MARPVKHISRWTEAERRWFERYQHHGNAAQAVREAGYDVDPEDFQGHARMGHEIANRPHIKAAIEAYGEELARRYALTPENILAEITKIAMGNIEDFYDLDEMVPRLNLKKSKRHERAALQSITVKRRILGGGSPPGGSGEGMDPLDDDERDDNTRVEIEEVKITMHPKAQALEMLGKHLKLFTDRLEIEGSTDPAASLQAARRRANLQIEREKSDGSGEDDGNG